MRPLTAQSLRRLALARNEPFNVPVDMPLKALGDSADRRLHRRCGDTSTDQPPLEVDLRLGSRRQGDAWIGLLNQDDASAQNRPLDETLHVGEPLACPLSSTFVYVAARSDLDIDRACRGLSGCRCVLIPRHLPHVVTLSGWDGETIAGYVGDVAGAVAPATPGVGAPDAQHARATRGTSGAGRSSSSSAVCCSCCSLQTSSIDPT